MGIWRFRDKAKDLAITRAMVIGIHVHYVSEETVGFFVGNVIRKAEEQKSRRPKGLWATTAASPSQYMTDCRLLEAVCRLAVQPQLIGWAPVDYELQDNGCMRGILKQCLRRWLWRSRKVCPDVPPPVVAEPDLVGAPAPIISEQ